MNKKTILPLALIGTAVYFLATKSINAAQILGKLTAVGGKIKKFSIQGLFSIDVQIEVQVQNTGSISIPLEYYTGTITHAGTQVSNFTFNGTGKNVILKERSTTPVIFNLKISTLSFVLKLVNVIKDIAAKKKVETLLYINSSFYAGGFDLPVNFTYDLKPAVLSGVGLLQQNVLNKNKGKSFLSRMRAKQFNNCACPPVKGIAGVKATLEFKTNSDMEDYFGGRKPLINILKHKN